MVYRIGFIFMSILKINASILQIQQDLEYLLNNITQFPVSDHNPSDEEIENMKKLFNDPENVQPGILIQGSGLRMIEKSNVQAIDQYGCWCYFQSDHGLGKGTVMNEIDGYCKTLHEGYSCAMIDGEINYEIVNQSGSTQVSEQSCIPWEIEYKSGLGIGNGFLTSITQQQLTDECNSRNSKNCQRSACIIEGWFVISFLKFIMTGEQINPDYKHSNGKFDPKQMCKRSISENPDPLFELEYVNKCCGEQPFRFPYKSLNGDRGCCSGKTYNTELSECCADGGVRLVC